MYSEINCPTCKSKFRKRSSNHLYCSSRCKDRHDNHTAKRKRWKAKNAASVAASSRKHHLRTKFGLTPDDYEAILDEQNGRCAICGTTDTSPWEWFCIDHDHATGNVRGLLCRACNTCIGQAMDDPGRLRAAISYLEARKEAA